jgi:NhaA family Na+:H+ antiporter
LFWFFWHNPPTEHSPQTTGKTMTVLEEFIKKESSAGITLIFVTILALLLKNSPLSELYNLFLHTPVEIRFGALHIDKPLYLWINDGLMAIFFLLIGLEVKREIIEGHLSTISQVMLPGIAAVGGMVVPALFYIYFNQDQPLGMQGWAIPTATDIAFALGILSLLGSRVPASLKVFLLALAIIDDLGAILIIAIFYTVDLSTVSITIALLAIATLIIMNRRGVVKKAAYIIVGIILWVSVLKSGVHATLAGVALAFTIPLKSTDKDGNEISLSKSIEHDLHFWVAFFVLPKQIGVFGFSFIAIKLKLASLPAHSSWIQLYGVSVLTGIGFTMSLFVDSLAFKDDALYEYADRLAILLASFLSGVAGYLILRCSKGCKVETRYE